MKYSLKPIGASAVDTHEGADYVLHVVTAPFTALSWVIDRLKHLDERPVEATPDGRIDLRGLSSKFYSSVLLFHTRVLKYGSQWSELAENGVNYLLSKSLSPLCFCRVGRSIQTNISKGLANLTRVVTFSAIQVFHIAPYLFAAGLLGGSILLFYSSPAALITCFVGTILLIQVLLIYQLIETVRWTNYHGQLISQRIVSLFGPIVNGVTYACNHPLRTGAVVALGLFSYHYLFSNDRVADALVNLGSRLFHRMS